MLCMSKGDLVSRPNLRHTEQIFEFQSLLHSVPVALHVSCLFEIEKHFRHALWCWPGNTAQAELTAWAVRNFSKWNSAIKIRNNKCLKGIFLWNSGFSDVLQCALLWAALLSCLWTADVWLLWLAEQFWSRRVVQEECLATRDELWGCWPSHPPRAGAVHVVVPFLAVQCAAGPSYLLTSQGQSCVWVGELENAPKMSCVLVFAKYFLV